MEDNKHTDELLSKIRKELTAIIDSLPRQTVNKSKQSAEPEASIQDVEDNKLIIAGKDASSTNMKRGNSTASKSSLGAKLSKDTIKHEGVKIKQKATIDENINIPPKPNKAKKHVSFSIKESKEITTLKHKLPIIMKSSTFTPIEEKLTTLKEELPIIIKSSTVAPIEKKLNIPTLNTETAAQRFHFLETQASKNIDEDLQKMQVELKKSYELFQSIAEKFESIDFSSLSSRIRDLHLDTDALINLNPTASALHKEFQDRFIENRLDKLTTDVGNGFRRHPGEFCDIPELSAFFQACTQLEHGLTELKKQSKESRELEKRMYWATEIAYDRMDEIRNSVGNSPTKNF